MKERYAALEQKRLKAEQQHREMEIQREKASRKLKEEQDAREQEWKQALMTRKTAEQQRRKQKAIETSNRIKESLERNRKQLEEKRKMTIKLIEANGERYKRVQERIQAETEDRKKRQKEREDNIRRSVELTQKQDKLRRKKIRRQSKEKCLSAELRKKTILDEYHRKLENDTKSEQEAKELEKIVNRMKNGEQVNENEIPKNISTYFHQFDREKSMSGQTSLLGPLLTNKSKETKNKPSRTKRPRSAFAKKQQYEDKQAKMNKSLDYPDNNVSKMSNKENVKKENTKCNNRPASASVKKTIKKQNEVTNNKPDEAAERRKAERETSRKIIRERQKANAHLAYLIDQEVKREEERKAILERLKGDCLHLNTNIANYDPSILNYINCFGCGSSCPYCRKVLEFRREKEAAIREIRRAAKESDKVTAAMLRERGTGGHL